MPKCSSCGTDQPDGAVFCDNCGQPLTGAGAPPQPVRPPAGPAPSYPAGPAPSYPPAGPPPAPAGAAPVCPACGTPGVAGEIYCSNCGAALTGAGAPVAGPAPAYPPAGPAPAPAYPPAGPAPAPAYYPSPAMVGNATLTTVTGQRLPLLNKAEYLIGREDPVSGVFPDVDLTPHGGDEGGVSRRHAIIRFVGGQWTIEDLDTTNHTWVNNQKIPARQQVPLQPTGTQVRLGKVALTFTSP